MIKTQLETLLQEQNYDDQLWSAESPAENNLFVHDSC